jgi:hypothetical protein
MCISQALGIDMILGGGDSAMMHCKAIGCKIAVKRGVAIRDAAEQGATTLVTATLTAPLTLPELRRREKKK